MPSRPIQVIPSGLLGFLNLKNGGLNPAVLPDELQGVLELRDWLFETNSEVVFASSATLIPDTQTTGNLTLLTVPAGQWWAIMDLDLELNVLAGQSFTARLQWREPTGRLFALSEYVTRTGATTQGTSMPRSYRIPIITPGSVVGMHFSAVTMNGSAMGGNMEARVAVLRS